MYQSYKVRRKSYRGWVIAVLAHVLLGWLLISGTARNGIKAVKKSLQAEVIQEVIIPPPPPPPPPPPVKQPVQMAKVQAPPPPAYVPPPEVAAPPSAAPVLAATTVVPAAPPPIAPPPPPAPPAAPPAPTKAEMSVACPKQVQPEMPAKAVNEGISGSVRAQARIKGGKVIDVSILSANPPRVFNNAVITAMRQYGCVDQGEQELLAVQEFNFKVED